MDSQKKSSSPKKTSRLGAAAARVQQTLNDMRDTEEKRQLDYQARLKEAKRAAAVVLSRMNRIEKEKRSAQERKFAVLLGRMVLTAMSRQGIAGSLLHADDFATWKAEDIQALKDLLAVNPGGTREEVEVQAEGFDVTQLDLDLSE